MGSNAAALIILVKLFEDVMSSVVQFTASGSRIQNANSIKLTIGQVTAVILSRDFANLDYSPTAGTLMVQIPQNTDCLVGKSPV